MARFEKPDHFIPFANRNYRVGQSEADQSRIRRRERREMIRAIRASHWGTPGRRMAETVELFGDRVLRSVIEDVVLYRMERTLL